MGAQHTAQMFKLCWVLVEENNIIKQILKLKVFMTRILESNDSVARTIYVHF